MIDPRSNEWKSAIFRKNQYFWTQMWLKFFYNHGVEQKSVLYGLQSTAIRQFRVFVLCEAMHHPSQSHPSGIIKFKILNTHTHAGSHTEMNGALFAQHKTAIPKSTHVLFRPNVCCIHPTIPCSFGCLFSILFCSFSAHFY